MPRRKVKLRIAKSIQGRLLYFLSPLAVLLATPGYEDVPQIDETNKSPTKNTWRESSLQRRALTCVGWYWTEPSCKTHHHMRVSLAQSARELSEPETYLIMQQDPAYNQDELRNIPQNVDPVSAFCPLQISLRCVSDTGHQQMARPRA